MDIINKILGYETSRDYERLADLMQHQSVICITDYGNDCRDVAQTIWESSWDGTGIWKLSARGICYIYARSQAEFIKDCARDNVEVLMPTPA